MEVLQVIGIHIGGSDVGAATKPPLAWNAIPLFCLKVSAGPSHAGKMYAARTAAVLIRNNILRCDIHATHSK